MMKKIILSLIFIWVFPQASWASVVSQPVPTLIEQASELQEKGEYLKAQKIYEEILKETVLASEELREIQSRYENLNMKIIFSRFETPSSIFYTVQEGDSLYKIAKKHQSTIALIKKSNALKSDRILPGMKLKIAQGVFSIRVDKSDNLLMLLLDEKPLKHYRVATGEDNGTPTGEFKIVTKLEDPTWYRAGAIVPAESPENILGTRWLGFDFPGYGIHGTTEPESIGKQVTAGCVRMVNEDVEELFVVIPRGTKVQIID